MITINFFRSRNLERIDYADVILYFEKDLKCEVIYGEEDVKFIYKDIVFDLEYNFSITKRSRVSNVSYINPEYVNVRFCLDVPVVMPEQSSREVLSLVDQVCRRFDFGVLYDGIKDVEPMTHCLDDFEYVLREDEVEESIKVDELLQNCDSKLDREVCVPKVVE